MKTIVYRITLLEPGLFTALEGDPNSGVSFPYIPGSVLRGALIHAYRATNAFDPAADATRQLFFNGKTRFLNAYPVVHDARSEPTPKTWQHVKRQDDAGCDAAIEKLDPEKQWDGYSAPFAAQADHAATLIQPERQLTIHIQRPREQGRPTRGNGAIFRYEALAPQQEFEATIECDKDADAGELEKLLKGEISLGGSRTGAYGRAQIKIPKNDDKEKTKAQTESTPKTNSEKLRVICMSDALLRDACGQYTSDPKVVRAAIAKRLGIDASVLGEPNAFMRTRYVGGFNRTWGLPLPQMLAIEMGSVFEFAAPPGAIDFTALETQGIGERRAEGFGRVARYQPVQALQTKKWEFVPEVSTQALDAESKQVAQEIVERLTRRRLDENVAASVYALKMDSQALKPISRAQLSRLRNLIQDELMFPESEKENVETGKKTPRERVKEYMANVMARSTSKKQFTRARVDGVRLADWIQEVMALDAKDKRLKEAFNLKGVPSLGQETPSLTPELEAEYALKFLDAALRRALKVKRDKEV